MSSSTTTTTTKLLLKFRPINKYEKEIYSSSEEMHLYLQHCELEFSPYYFTPLSVHHLFDKKPESPAKFSKSFLENGIIDYASSCNGILHLFSDDASKGSVLWNPTSEEFKSIHLPTIAPPKVGYEYSYHKHYVSASGFGYDSKTDDYKVITFLTHTFENDDEEDEYGYKYKMLLGYESQAMLYSCKNDSWKLLPCDYVPLRGWAGVYLDGCYYWLQRGIPYSEIFSFDFATESFSSLISMSQISPSLDMDYSLHLVGFQGKLGVVAFSYDYFELWAMDGGDGGCWVKKFEFTADLDEEDVRDGYVFLSPLGFFDELLFLKTATGRIYVYDHVSDEMKKTSIEAFNIERMQLISYVETTNMI